MSFIYYMESQTLVYLRAKSLHGNLYSVIGIGSTDYIQLTVKGAIDWWYIKKETDDIARTKVGIFL